MKIGLFGYGKMGKMIEQIAQDRGHSIVAKIDDPSQDVEYASMDVAIDFSTPEAAFGNITNCFKNKVPVISGTTGWLDKFSEAIKICEEHKSAFIYASNFSLGVNIFFELNKHLAKMMDGSGQYKVSMEEIHHTQKLDAPSGTAITLAEGIIEHTPYENWKLEQSGDKIIPIKSIREGMVPGTHSISYKSSVDTIEIKHEAHNREGFALGAVIASEWIHGKTGVFSMKDVLNLS
ncbi:4-hydroxy-tetrahydrodipicolinate reductase [Flagellimonas halotolerans]|uniref:4-hydroxy-tetrahydrodipicolinate reductase n=1 Tax=Flagellimonas halotolerans TaxID=3112164 RepID=A0ABU6IQN2_9FLAO|nr:MULTISPECIES: 4-hydroxy-tetrahydrodipicolinate reductase [unclassified Allomuricauda]MEC3965554.1 4-hydroxy-tetrahydrodipicolinate reductase [Muricauda sp. SYSU M86414]MEC4265420.1 4-hydroxy-tetrahydrodipicolinate reductase [Muricauda sp. SYSU M84420]